MRDEHDDRIHQALRHDLATNVAGIAKSIAYAFDRLHQRLYAALAEQWLRHGLTGHYVTIPARREAAEPWFDLGFGRLAAMAIRDTAPPPEAEAGRGLDVTVRRANADDEDAVQALVTELVRALAAPPCFAPFFHPHAIAAVITATSFGTVTPLSQARTRSSIALSSLPRPQCLISVAVKNCW